MKIRTIFRALALLSVLALWQAAGNSAVAAVPSAPTTFAPANGASVVEPFTISWSSVSDPNGIIAYNYQVSTTSSFTTLVLQGSTNVDSTQGIISGLVNGVYFWRTQAVNSAGQQGAWSPVSSFSITGVGPGTPGTPALNQTRAYTTFHPYELIHYSWSAVPNAVSYRLEVSNNPAFPMGQTAPSTVTFWIDNIPSNSYEYQHTIEGNWFARVFAVSADNPQTGVRSLPSNVIQFSCFYNNPIGPAPVLLSPLNNPTVTLPVTLNWAHVPNPQPSGYTLEVAKDPQFRNIEFMFNQYTDPTVVMQSLTPGQKYWHVRSEQGLSTPLLPALTAWSTTGTFTVKAGPALPASVLLEGNPQNFIYSGGLGMVAVQLTAAVPAGGANITLTSSNPGVLPVPATLFMQGNIAWTDFPIMVGQVTTPTVVTITATLNGVSTSGSITVRPPTLNDQILQFQQQATGGATLSGWVDLEGNGLAGPNGAAVSVSSDSPAVIVPAIVTIPAGINGTSFDIETTPVRATTVATITASFGGVTTHWTITLTPSPAPTSFLISPISAVDGSFGLVTVPTNVGHDQILQVSSSNPALAQVPDVVTVAAVSGEGGFDIITAPVTAPTPVTISVTGGGITLSQTLTVFPSLPRLTSFTIKPMSVIGGTPATGSVTLSAPAPAPGVTLNVQTRLPLAAKAPDTVFIPAGATSVNFPITTFPHDTTTVLMTATLGNSSLDTAIGVNPPTTGPSLASVSIRPTTVVGGGSSTGTVTLSTAAPSGGAVVTLSDDSSAVTVPASVRVPAGATSAPFAISTQPVTTAITAAITASYGGASSIASLGVTPATTAPPAAPAAPSQVNPANSASFTSGQNVTFDWSDVTGVTSYTIQIASSSSFAAPLVRSQTVTASQYADSALPNGTLWWRVQATNSAGVSSAWSAVRTLTVTASAPPPPTLTAPSLLSPASDARFSPGQVITFDWSDVTGAASYTIQISDSDNFTSPLIVNQAVIASQYTDSTLPRKTMWFRVRATGTAGNTGPWSATRRFRVQ